MIMHLIASLHRRKQALRRDIEERRDQILREVRGMRYHLKIHGAFEDMHNIQTLFMHDAALENVESRYLERGR